jgi:hypothetical protein
VLNKMMLHDVDVAGAHFSPSKTLSGTGFNAKGEGSLAADYTEFFRSLTGTAVSERISSTQRFEKGELRHALVIWACQDIPFLFESLAPHWTGSSVFVEAGLTTVIAPNTSRNPKACNDRSRTNQGQIEHKI